jgi:hypothetical protein
MGHKKAREDMGVAFERYVKRKWKDALNNVAAAEPSSWETSGVRPERGKWKSQAPRNHQLIGPQEPEGRLSRPEEWQMLCYPTEATEEGGVDSRSIRAAQKITPQPPVRTSEI